MTNPDDSMARMIAREVRRQTGTDSGGIFDRLSRPTVSTLALAAVVCGLALWLHLTGVLHAEVAIDTTAIGPAVQALRELAEGLGVLYAVVVAGRAFSQRISGGGE